MTPARVLRVRFASEMGRPCCRHIAANADALATAGRVIAALALPVKARAVAAPEIESQMGLDVVRYAFELAVPNRRWVGSGSASDEELMNPANWRMA